MTHNLNLDVVNVLRAKPDLLFTSSPGSRRAVILDQRFGRYIAVPLAAIELLHDLARAERGRTVAECQALHPRADIDRLVALGVVDVEPADGLPGERRLVAELAVENVRAQATLRAFGWRAARKAMRPAMVPSRVARPLFCDRAEVAANDSFAIPGTSRLCTVVAIAAARVLTRHGFPAHVEVATASDQIDPHAYAVHAGHRVDPSEDQNVAPVMRQVGT